MIRFVLAVTMVAVFAVALGSRIAGNMTTLAADRAAFDTLQHSLAALHIKQAEFDPGAPQYKRYAVLAASGALASQPPETLRHGLKTIARATGVTLINGTISPPVTQPITGGLPGLDISLRHVSLSVDASSDTAIFAFLDGLHGGGYGMITLDRLDIGRQPEAIVANIALTQTVITGAPTIAVSSDAVMAETTPLADGKSLFATVSAHTSNDAVAAPPPATMFIQVEQAEK